MRAYTYGVSTVGGVLDLSLMQLHLLLRQNRLHLGVFFPYDFEEVFCEDFRTLHLSLVGPSGGARRGS